MSLLAGAMVEIWQANRHGRYSHERDPNPAPLDPNYQGWAQIVTGDDGGYAFRTIKPGAYPVNEQMTRSVSRSRPWTLRSPSAAALRARSKG